MVWIMYTCDLFRVYGFKDLPLFFLVFDSHLGVWMCVFVIRASALRGGHLPHQGNVKARTDQHFL